jgi:hypothetical protein
LVMWQHILYLRMRCFSAGSGLAIASALPALMGALREDQFLFMIVSLSVLL